MEACGIHETTYNSIMKAMLTLGRTCTPTPSCPEAPPCTPVLLIECRRRSPPSLPPPSRSRLSLLLRGSTLSGSEDPSWPPSPPSSRCGSPSRSMTSLAHPLSTGSVSKYKLQQLLFYCILTHLQPRVSNAFSTSYLLLHVIVSC